MDKEEMTPEEIKKQYAYLKKLNLEGYLWEFLRRNEEYKKLYEVYEEYNRKRRIKGGLVRHFEMLFASYGLRCPLDPSKRGDDKDAKGKWLRSCLVSIRVVKILEGDSMRPSKDRLVVSIDLRVSDERILSALKEILRRAKEEFKKRRTREARRARKRKPDRVRTKDWYYYLVAYDLAHECRYRVRDIVNILYERQDETDLRRKVRRCIKQAEDFINNKAYFKFLPIR